MLRFVKNLLLILLVVSLNNPKISIAMESKEINDLIKEFKKDERGPYQSIRWFCPDGVVLPPSQRCPQPGGIQHALHKDIVQKIADEQGIYLGQILAGTSFDAFFDLKNGHSRMIQYQIEKYLHLIDDGWIMRRARYYRGAVQAEDEESWGENYLKWLISDENIRSRFFLIRQAAKDITHRAQDERWNRIRSLAKTISDRYPRFTELRAKIHGQPGREDIQKVKAFLSTFRNDIPLDIQESIQMLISELTAVYQPIRLHSLRPYLTRLSDASIAKRELKRLLEQEDNLNSPAMRAKEMSDMLWQIRLDLVQSNPPQTRLAMMDLSNDLEQLIFLDTLEWDPITIDDLFEKVAILAKAVAGCGYLEIWEWHAISSHFETDRSTGTIRLPDYLEKAANARKVVEWGAGMVRSWYTPAVAMMARFEPLATGFIDDRIHGALLLPLGETVGKLSAQASRFVRFQNRVLNIPNQHDIRGLNPGFSVGELVVLKDTSESTVFESEKIYILAHPPADLKPVAGIATVSEGNLVSHVQLLARNLGIPNAVLSDGNFSELRRFAGHRIFYAVSPKGSVLMKPEAEMTPEEKQLVAIRKKQEAKIAVPVEKLQLDQTLPISLIRTRASDSGRICGPKAANLGELKHIFPDRVVDGIVLPFGIFRAHLDQLMPDSDLTYWTFLQNIFGQAVRNRENGQTENTIEKEILQQLSLLRSAIRQIPINPEFQQLLENKFLEEFNIPMGRIPVFIRSDTNMEDLKDFTGAGLNLTVFNVLEKEKILQAIRDVWASPFSERSYQWRQKYLLNPQNVYPSILVLPSVNVEKSGVMITSGISSGNPEDSTVAFSRGAGGAVEGQISETYLLSKDGLFRLLSPSREFVYTALPPTGGILKQRAALNEPILTSENLHVLSLLSQEIRKKLAKAPGIESTGPFDVELGFHGDNIQLFQARPFVENRMARSSDYLSRMDPVIPELLEIPLHQPLNSPESLTQQQTVPE